MIMYFKIIFEVKSDEMNFKKKKYFTRDRNLSFPLVTFWKFIFLQNLLQACHRGDLWRNSIWSNQIILSPNCLTHDVSTQRDKGETKTSTIFKLSPNITQHSTFHYTYMIWRMQAISIIWCLRMQRKKMF